MRLFDTMTRELRELSPLDGETFRFYCCGPTVYGPAHIGNFRTFVLQDVFRRTLELTGLKAYHVRNLTDVDDKTIRDSQAAGKTLTEFTDYWRDRFHEDCEALNNLPPHLEPSAVEHIPHQIKMIEADNGFLLFSLPLQKLFRGIAVRFSRFFIDWSTKEVAVFKNFRSF